MGVFIWSCSKDTTSDTDVNLETRSLPGDGKGVSGNAIVKWDKSESYQRQYTIAGRDIIGVGDFEVSYCQDPFTKIDIADVRYGYFLSSSGGNNTPRIRTKTYWHK